MAACHGDEGTRSRKILPEAVARAGDQGDLSREIKEVTYHVSAPVQPSEFLARVRTNA